VLARRAWLLTTTAAVLFLTACASRPTVDSGPSPGSVSTSRLPGDPVPRQEPRSRYGNGPYYEVFGQTYKVLDTSYGYQERGVASWYGKKFHGRMTSSQEPYDMYAMTAAHKSLPLPTYVRVRNLKNNRSIIVRVNDRGPFVDNRLIDLSYAAAMKLDMVRDGTSLVEVTAISFDEAPPEARRVSTQPKQSPPSPVAIPGADVFVQVGAFGDVDNAKRRYRMLRDGGVGPLIVHEDKSAAQTLYRIRIGPIADATEYDSIVARLQRLGITESHLVTN
jgi:rare lipoprotein A